MKVAIINGGATALSSNHVIADVFSSMMQARGLDTRVLNVYEQNLPLMVSEGDENVARVRLIVEESEAIVLITPLYHGGYSGVLKLFLDQLSHDAFGGKRIVLVSSSSKLRNAQVAAQELIPVVWTMKGTVHRLVGICSNDFVKDDAGTRTLVDVETLERISKIADEIATGKNR